MLKMFEINGVWLEKVKPQQLRDKVNLFKPLSSPLRSDKHGCVWPKVWIPYDMLFELLVAFSWKPEWDFMVPY